MNTQFVRHAGIFLITGTLIASCSVDQRENESDRSNPIAVQVQTPSQHSGEIITVSGRVEPQTTAIISTRVMGFISDIKVNPGDNVRKGQLLAVISSGDLLARRAQAEALIAEAGATMKDAQKDYERFEILYHQQSATQKEFENATLRYTSARAKAEGAGQMKKEVDEILAYTNLVAPFSGIITQRHVDEGTLANPGMPLLTLEEPNSDVIKAFVSENDVDKVKIGMQADVSIKSTGKKINGKVVEVSPSSQFTGGLFQIKVIIPVSDTLNLYSGMYVNVDIPIQSASGIKSVLVPASAVIHKDQLSGLYTISDNQTAQLRWIKIGRQFGEDVEVLSGLYPEEKFIAKSDGRLSNGVPVLVK